MAIASSRIPALAQRLSLLQAVPLDGTWERLHAAVRERVRVRLKRNPQPSAGIKTLLDRAKRSFPRLSHLWMDGGYTAEDKGGDWVQKTLGWKAEIVSRPRKPAPEEVLMRWARELAKEGVSVDWRKLMPPQGFVVLPRRWVVERTFSWIGQNRRMSLGITSVWPLRARRLSTWL